MGEGNLQYNRRFVRGGGGLQYNQSLQTCHDIGLYVAHPCMLSLASPLWGWRSRKSGCVKCVTSIYCTQISPLNGNIIALPLNFSAPQINYNNLILIKPRNGSLKSSTLSSTRTGSYDRFARYSPCSFCLFCHSSRFLAADGPNQTARLPVLLRACGGRRTPRL